MFAKDAEINITAVLKKLSEIIAARGKKRTDRREQIELLHELQSIADAHSLGPAVAVKIKFSIVSSIFDYNPKVSDAMKPEYWSKYVQFYGIVRYLTKKKLTFYFSLRQIKEFSFQFCETVK